MGELIWYSSAHKADVSMEKEKKEKEDKGFVKAQIGIFSKPINTQI